MTWGLGGAFILGVVAGLRTFTAPAVLFLARGGWAGIVLGVLALAEFGVDLMPNTPARTGPPGLAARIVSGAVVGWFFAGAAGAPAAAGALAGVVGAVVGAFGGKAVRFAAIGWIGAIPAALLEDLVAIGLAVFVVTRPT